MAQEPFDPDTGEITEGAIVPEDGLADDPLSIRTTDEDFEKRMRAALEEGADHSDPFPEEDDGNGAESDDDVPLDPGDITSDDGNDDEACGGDPDAIDGEIDPEEDLAGGFVPPNPLSLDTLFGDVRDALVSRFQHTRKPWEQMTEQEQREVVEAFGQTAKHIIRGVVSLMTAYEFPRAVVTLGQVNIKDKKVIEAKITCQNIEDYRSVLGEAVGEDMILLAVDSDVFMAQRGDFPTKGQQMAMDF